MTTTDPQATLDAMRAQLGSIAGTLLEQQRTLDGLMRALLYLRDEDIPASLGDWNSFAWARQDNDGRLGGSGQVVRLEVRDQGVRVDPAQITVRGNAVTLSGNRVAIQGDPMDLAASTVRLHAARVTIDGTLKCSTVQATNFVVRVYKAGVGNVW